MTLRCCRAALLAVAIGTAQAAPLSATASEPRAYGYQLGDVVTRTVSVHVPEGLTLDESSVPLPGARGKAIELRSVARRGSNEAGGRRHDLTLEYQVFLSPPQTRTLETPTFTLRFTGQPRAQELRIEGWPITVSPIMPVEASPRRGLGDLQPDVVPPLIATSATRHRLIAYAVIAALLLVYLAHVYIGLPFWARTRRPFTSAWRSLRGLSSASAPEQSRAAYQQLHEALNRTAGEVVFEGGVERFVQAQPRFAPLREDLKTFFAKSRQQFFGEAATASQRRELAGRLRPALPQCRARLGVIHFDHPWLLLLLPLAALPLLAQPGGALVNAWLVLMPRDRVSDAFAWALRAIGVLRWRHW